MNAVDAKLPIINPEGYIFSETVYPDETGLPVPIFAHTCQEFITSMPVMGVRISANWNDKDSGWATVTIGANPIDIYNKLSPVILSKVKQYIALNKEKLIKYWHFDTEPNITAAKYLEKLK